MNHQWTRSLLILATAGTVALTASPTARAHGDEEHPPPQNLKVLNKALGEDLEQGMKQFTKGLGVKCDACHEKGKFEVDTVPSKVKARAFLKVALGKDKTKRSSALKVLLEAMKLKKAKSEKKIWKAMDIFAAAKGKKN
jgi:hypothetical protein